MDSSHQIKIDMNKVEYALGVSYKEALDIVNRTINGLYTVIEALQQRVLELELIVDDMNNKD